ncbi:ABC-F family ATP-binding cassette domain-containing protein [Promicromonospora sp. NPDC090134]|uniref:ABC-F family ATP-binding cassette domain-containing protein n=1 Tax=Promicromonospora sp. NPDC090134 TaxID=3364408 RepID=UPI0037FC9112
MIARDLVRTFGLRRVLDGVSITVAPGRRIGLIGENGVGKSTLLRLLAGTDEPDGGDVVRPAELGFLEQELPFEAEQTVADVLDDALRESRDDLAALDRLTAALAERPDDDELLTEYGDRLDRAQDRQAWDVDRRAAIVLAGLGLGDLGDDRRLGTLSGGQRGRLALAALLVRRPAALLLDEPTNHLDDAAAGFVEEELRGMSGVVVVSSHDRAFLDAVCTDLIDLDPAADGPVQFGGSYTQYREQKQADRARWRRRYDEEQAELARLRLAVAETAHDVAPGRLKRDNEKMGFGHTAGRVQNQIARRVRSSAARLDALERDQTPEPPDLLRFHEPLTRPVTEPTEPLVSVRGIHVPGRLGLDRLDLRPGDRLLVSGPNGAGKSTLLAVLAGRLTPSGLVRRRAGLTVGLLTQDTTFSDPDRSARETYELTLGPERADLVPLTGLGLLAPRDLDTAVGRLSVGQRRRLALALLIADPPELLLLDEPTNHLSPTLADDLEQALGTSPGTTVLATHDRWLRTRWPHQQLALGQRQLSYPK